MRTASRSRKSFSPELLQQLREMLVTAALDAMGLYWKRDPDYVPVKDKNTVWVNVALGGAVDLVMYLLRLDFVTAVKRFQ